MKILELRNKTSNMKVSETSKKEIENVNEFEDTSLKIIDLNDRKKDLKK